ncbi:hypothetical protein ACLKA7_012415 [Drosophila subpalustris]
MPRQRLVPSVAGHYQRACRVSDYAASKRPLHWPADRNVSVSRQLSDGHLFCACNQRVLLAVQLQVFADRRIFPVRSWAAVDCSYVARVNLYSPTPTSRSTPPPTPIHI